MELLAGEQLRELMGRRDAPCLSIFMPTHRSGGEIKQDQIRFRNMLRQAAERLDILGFKNQENRNFLEPLHKLTANILFWRNQMDGLAVFVTPNFFSSLSLPLAFEELVLVSDRFHLKPLVPLFGHVPRYYLLSLSQNQVKLFEGTNVRLVEVHINGFPASMKETLDADEPEKQVRFHGAAARGGDRSAMMSGHGAEIDDTKDNLLRFFRKIDSQLRSYLRDFQAPLVLAGVEFLLPIYREVNNYGNIIAEGIPGNFQGQPLEALHRQSWPLVKPVFTKKMEGALAQYRQLSGTGLAADDIETIVAAAHHGRIAHFFISRGATQWGFHEPEKNFVRLLEEQEPGSEDLLDYAAVHTYLAGGAVYVIPREEMPDRRQLAAVLRY